MHSRGVVSLDLLDLRIVPREDVADGGGGRLGVGLAGEKRREVEVRIELGLRAQLACGVRAS